ncbi:MAG: ParB/RepB/Spo0J family partition protein [Firmicutes bacterium]|nr:ParB/RepB/Spo0J family partition protein [Bacillota bacterium]
MAVGRGTERVVDMFLAGPGAAGAERSRRHRIMEIPVDAIIPNPGQPRKEFIPEKITELAESIREHGVLQPIGIRVIDKGYEIVFGERRWRAAKEAGLKTVPCVIIPGDVDLRSIALIENIHRQDLSAMEKAMAIRDMMAAENLSLEAAGKKLGLGKTRVHQLLNILNLPEEMLTVFCRADLNETHARALLLLKKLPAAQQELFQEIVVHGLTGNQALVRAEVYLRRVPVKTPVSDVVSKSILKLEKVEKRWHSMKPDERERCASELTELKQKIDHFLGKLKQEDL